MNNTTTQFFCDTLASYRGKPYEEARALPGAFYTDPRFLELERAELFGKEWICVGRVEEVPNQGDYLTFDVADEPIIVVRGDDGVVRALSNVCRHRGTKIASNSGNVRNFVCPYHHWSYDTSGRLVNAPNIESRVGFDLQDCRLPELKCDAWQGFLFVSLDPAAMPVVDRLAGLSGMIGNYHLEEMKLRYLADEVWDTNWKCLLENFMEGYHLSPLHRRTLHKVNPSGLCRHFDPGDAYFGYLAGFATRLPEDRIGHTDLSEEEFNNCVMFSVPPGLAVGAGSDYSSFLCIRPESIDRVRVKLGLIFFGDTWSMAQVDEAVALFRNTMAEDKTVLVELQRGLGSRFHAPGPLAPRDMEGPIWDFYQYLSRRLEPVLSG